MNYPVQASVNSAECLLNQKNNPWKSQGNFPQLLYWKSKQERTKRKDQAWRRLATINKIAQKPGYNLPDYSEKRTIAELLAQHGEYSYLTGKKLGTHYLSTLDIDIRKEEFSTKLTARLEKNTTCLLNSLQVSYDKTKKGLHVDILTPKPLDNQQIYYQGWAKFWNIGSIQSKGKYVVGEDQNKAFIKSGKWYWKAQNREEIKTTLGQFFFKLGNQTKETLKTVQYPAWDYNLNQAVRREYELTIEEFYKKPLPHLAKKHTIQAKILSKLKTPLPDLWKIFYLDQAGQRGYCLINEYQKNFPNLSIGSIRNIVLVQGRKHAFFSHFC